MQAQHSMPVLRERLRLSQPPLSQRISQWQFLPLPWNWRLRPTM